MSYVEKRDKINEKVSESSLGFEFDAEEHYFPKIPSNRETVEM